MASLKDRLQEILIRDKLITEKELQKALALQKKSGGQLSQILVELNLINEETLSQVLSEGLGLPPINIQRLKIDSEVISIISKETAEKYQIMPISALGDHLTLAMADPLNIFVIEDVQALTGFTIIPIIGRSSDIRKTIEKYYGEGQEQGDEKGLEIFEDIMQDMKDTEGLELVKDSQATEKGAVEELVDEAPIIKLTDTIIQQSVLANASDVFIEPMEKTVRIRYRIDGIIHEIDKIAKVLHFPIISRIKVISNLDISEHRLPQDGRFRTVISNNREVDFRVSVLPTALGEKIVFIPSLRPICFILISPSLFKIKSFVFGVKMRTSVIPTRPPYPVSVHFLQPLPRKSSTFFLVTISPKPTLFTISSLTS